LLKSSPVLFSPPPVRVLHARVTNKAAVNKEILRVLFIIYL
jgi:hypothetical protein